MPTAGMRKRWSWKEPPAGLPAPDDSIDRLAQALGLPLLLARLLVQRGLTEPEVARKFFAPKLTDLHDPALLPGIPQAARRLAQAVRQQQPIVIYGDYDVDGVCAAAILWHVLRLAGAAVATYVPHRLEEGYGLNAEALAKIAQGQLADNCVHGYAGSSPVTASTSPPGAHSPLVITVDCGITAAEPARMAHSLGLELIITDHHEFNASALPEGCILVHPRLSQTDAPPYPFGQLCGAGVAFKLAWQFAKEWSGSQRVPSDFKALLLDLLSLAALGTVADIVPLVDENRLLTIFGLGHIKHTRFAGLNALIDASKLRDEKIDAYHVGFVLGPRLNACGRMGHAREAVHLLTAADAAESEQIATFLCTQNDARRAVERAIFTQAKALVEERGYHQPDCRAIVLGQEGWHAGVVGIVASRLVETFHRPVVLLSITEDQAHGSARSVPGISIHEALTHCAEHLTGFGGHAMAAGLRLAPAGIETFRQALVAFINHKLPAEHLIGVLEIDADCRLDELNLPLFEHLQKLAPFGAGNAAPLLCLREVTLAGPVRRMGTEGKHLRLLLRWQNRTIEAVWFSAGDLTEQLAPGAVYDIVFRPVASTWQGVRRMELHVHDARCVQAHA